MQIYAEEKTFLQTRKAKNLNTIVDVLRSFAIALDDKEGENGGVPFGRYGSCTLGIDSLWGTGR